MRFSPESSRIQLTSEIFPLCGREPLASTLPWKSSDRCFLLGTSQAETESWWQQSSWRHLFCSAFSVQKAHYQSCRTSVGRAWVKRWDGSWCSCISCNFDGRTEIPTFCDSGMLHIDVISRQVLERVLLASAILCRFSGTIHRMFISNKHIDVSYGFALRLKNEKFVDICIYRLEKLAWRKQKKQRLSYGKRE